MERVNNNRRRFLLGIGGAVVAAKKMLSGLGTTQAQAQTLVKLPERVSQSQVQAIRESFSYLSPFYLIPKPNSELQRITDEDMESIVGHFERIQKSSIVSKQEKLELQTSFEARICFQKGSTDLLTRKNRERLYKKVFESIKVYFHPFILINLKNRHLINSFDGVPEVRPKIQILSLKEMGRIEYIYNQIVEMQTDINQDRVSMAEYAVYVSRNSQAEIPNKEEIKMVIDKVERVRKLYGPLQLDDLRYNTIFVAEPEFAETEMFEKYGVLQNKDDILSGIANKKGPLKFIFNGHNFTNKNQPESANLVISTKPLLTISPEEFASAYYKMHLNQKRQVHDIPNLMYLGNCLSTNFVLQLEKEFKKMNVSLPPIIILAASEENNLAFNSVITDPNTKILKTTNRFLVNLIFKSPTVESVISRMLGIAPLSNMNIFILNGPDKKLLQFGEIKEGSATELPT